MALTYEPIATTTFGSAASNYTFSSIPSTYTDLILVVSGKAAVNPGYGMAVQFNGDTAGNYNSVYMYGDGTSTATASRITQNQNYLSYGTGVSSSSPSIFIAHFQSYSNSSTYKTMISRASNYDTNYRGTEIVYNIWLSTSAINSIKVLAPFGSMTLDVGTTMTLYGIKAA